MEEKKAKKLSRSEIEENVLRTVLLSRYSPQGRTADKVFKTAAELAYEFESVVSVTPFIIANELIKAKFTVRFVGNIPYWVLYEISLPDHVL